MRISKAFASNYLKAADIPEPTMRTIENVVMEKMPEGDEKPVIHFAGCDQSLVLNKTNAAILSDLLGDETAAWHGSAIELYSSTTSYAGKIVPCIRVQAPQQRAAALQPDVPPPHNPPPMSPPVPHPPAQPSPAFPGAAPAPDYPLDA